MNAVRTLVALAALGVPAAMACSGKAGDGLGAAAARNDAGDPSGPEAGPGAFSVSAPMDAAADVAKEAAEAAPAATRPAVQAMGGVRVANWSLHAPAIDLCIAPHGQGTFLGPLAGSLLQGLDSDDAGIEGGLPPVSFGQATSYALVPPGAYNARLVAAGSPNCASAIGEDATNLFTLAAGGYVTVALEGDENAGAGAAPLRLAAYQDDAFAAGGGALRVIHLAVSPSLRFADFGEIDPGSKAFLPLFLAVAFGHLGTTSEALLPGGLATAVDPNGYATIPPLGGGTISFRARNGAVDLALATGVSIAAGAVVTMVALGSDADSFQLIECVDNAPALQTLGRCGVVSGSAGATGLP